MVGYSPLDYGASIGLAQAAVPDIMGIMDKGRLRALQEGTLRQNQLEHADKQAKLLEYRTDVAAFEKEPTDENLARLMAKWPDQANELKTARDVRHDASTNAELTRLGEIDEGLRGDNYEPVLKKLKERAAADATAGHEPDDITNNLIMALESRDEAKINAAKAAVKTAMYRAYGGKEYLEYVTGGKPDVWEKKLDILTREGGQKMRRGFLETTAFGPPVPAYDPDTNVLTGRVSIGALPDVTPGGGATTAPPGGDTITDDHGNTWQAAPSKNGLKAYTSAKWPRGVVYLVHSKQEADKLESGDSAIMPDGEIWTKP